MDQKDNQLDQIARRGGPDAPSPGQAARRSARPTSKLWLIFVAAGALQIAAWTTWFIIAAHHPVEEVPLATAR